MALLELKGITAGYGQNVILRDFNLNVERGEFVSLLRLFRLRQDDNPAPDRGLFRADAGYDQL